MLWHGIIFVIYLANAHYTRVFEILCLYDIVNLFLKNFRIRTETLD